MAVAGRSSVGDVFCNFPFDQQYEALYRALIAAILCTGQTPRTILEIPAGEHRLDRLLQLVARCPYSVHDLSRVQRSTGPMRVPRFNMPFELGLAVCLARRAPTRHQFRLLEAVPHRLQQSLSDLNGYDPFIHHNTIDGMFDAVRDMFVELRPFPIDDQPRFRQVNRALRVFDRRQLRAETIYTANRFIRLVVAGREYVREFSTA